VRRTRLTALALAALLLPAAAHSKTTGFQLEAQGLGAQPSWSSSNSTVKLGGGTGGRVLFGLSRNLYAGIAVAYFKNRRDYAYAVSLPGPPVNGVRAPRDSNFALVGGPGRRVLSTLPFEAVLQYRTARTAPLNAYGEIGGGVTTSIAKVNIGEASNSAIEQLPSLLLGAGVIASLGRNVEMTTSLAWHQSWSSGGKVWEPDDSPRFLTFGVGIRYPKF
jgi:hypothetical protein